MSTGVRRTGRGWVIVAVAGLIAAGCAGAKSGSRAAPAGGDGQPGGTLVVGGAG